MRLGWAVLAAAGPARHHKTIELAGGGWCWWWRPVRPAARHRPAETGQPSPASQQQPPARFPCSSPAAAQPSSPAPLTNDEPHSLVRGWWPGMVWPGPQTWPSPGPGAGEEAAADTTTFSWIKPEFYDEWLAPAQHQPARARGSRPRLPRRTGTGTAEWFDDFCAEHDSLDTAAGHAALQLQHCSQLQQSLFTGA